MAFRSIPRSKDEIVAASPLAAAVKLSLETRQLGGKSRKRKLKKKPSSTDGLKKKWKSEWYEPGANNPHAFSGLSSFSKPESTRQEKKVKEQWLENEETYQIHRPARKNYPRRPFVVNAIDDQWQADLSDLTYYKTINRGYAWMLIVIDVLSRKCWTAALKRKTGEETARGLKEIFTRVQLEDGDHNLPRTIYVDKGSEFYNHNVKTLLKTYDIPPTLLSGDDSTTKAAIVERLQRTIKGRLYRHFTSSGSNVWVDILPNIVEAYNYSTHRTIKRAPIEVNKINEEEVWGKLYGEREKYRHTFAQAPSEAQEMYFKYKVNDVVRISKQAAIFRKGYLPQWGEEWFVVRARDHGPPPYYRLREYGADGVEPEVLTGTFYDTELQLVTNEHIKNATFRIESIVKRRRDPMNKKIKQVLVKYQGWPSHYNQWINESEMHSL